MTDVLATALTRRLGCRLPVIQTAMGWIAKPELVAATSNAGAFGFLAAAVMTPIEAREEIARLRGISLDAVAQATTDNFVRLFPGTRHRLEQA